MKLPIKPLEYKVLVEVRPVEAITAGGIHIPEQARQQQQTAREVGKLVAVGSIAFQDPIWPEHPEVDDYVLFNRYAGSELRWKGKEYRLVADKDLGAIVDKEFTEEVK